MATCNRCGLWFDTPTTPTHICITAMGSPLSNTMPVQSVPCLRCATQDAALAQARAEIERLKSYYKELEQHANDTRKGYMKALQDFCIVRNQRDQATAENADLKRLLAEAQKDAERLDWLRWNSNLELKINDPSVRYGSRHEHYYPAQDLRAAIDAAREGDANA